MLRKYQTILMVFSSLMFAGLLILGFWISLVQANFGQAIRVTISSANDRESVFPSLNADGSKVAFHSNSDFLGQGIPKSQIEIWLYDTATMTVTRITTASSDSRASYNPSINGMGSRIAFESDSDFLSQGISDDQMEIWLYDTAATTLTRVTTASPDGRNSRVASLSADGLKIAFESNADFLGQGIPSTQKEIWLYDTATKAITCITTASLSGRNSRAPSLSGDGAKITFHSNSDFLGQGIPSAQNEIWLYNTATMTVTRITTASSPGRNSWFPAVSEDGSKVAFYSDSDFLNQGIPDNQMEIWLYDLTTLTFTRVTTSSADNRDNLFPSLNEDGSKVAFYSNSDFMGQGISLFQFEIWVYDTASSLLTRISTASPTGRNSWSPSLSSDGSTVSFYSDSDFLSQNIPAFQEEIWLFALGDRQIYLPIIIKGS